MAVFMAEAFKLPFCIAMTAWSCGGPTKVWGVLRTEICEMWTDALKCAHTRYSLNTTSTRLRGHGPGPGLEPRR